MGGLHIDLLKSSGEFEPSSVLFEEFKITLLPNGSSVIYSFNKQIEYLLCQALCHINSNLRYKFIVIITTTGLKVHNIFFFFFQKTTCCVFKKIQ